MFSGERAVIDRIEKAARNGLLGAGIGDLCMYTHEGKFCAIGCVMSERLLKVVVDEHWTSYSLHALAREFTARTLEAEIGLPFSVLRKIQAVHDDISRKRTPGSLFDAEAFIKQLAPIKAQFADAEVA